ncbi:MAG: DNA topoisomerase VI subunit B [Desulfurococcaceae archaeon]
MMILTLQNGVAMSGVEEVYRSLSPAEFFYKYREVTGFSNPAKAVYQTVRELVENALDAADVYGILPDVKVSIKKADETQDFYKITVEDNGIGIPPNIVPSAFGKVLFSSKYILRQSRGMYGLGVKMVVLYAQMTTGRPVEVITSKAGYRRIYFFKLRIDVDKNEPVVIEAGSWRKSRDWHGTVVSVTIEGDWNRARHRVLEYLYRTAIVLPYANIVLITPENEVVYYHRIINTLPRPPVETKPHPQGADLELINNMVKNGNSKTVEQLLVENFQGIGEATAKLILTKANIDPAKSPNELTEEELLALVNTMKSYDRYRPPSPRALSPLGEEIITAGLKRAFNPEYVNAVVRRPGAYNGHPFIVEAGIAYGGKAPIGEDKPVILRYANKIPLLYDEGTDVVTDVVREDISWEHYAISFPAPLVILVHVCSTKVPFKGVGKESIADVPELRKEIKLAVMEVARGLKQYLSKKAKEEEAMRRAESVAKYVPEVARSLALILAEKEMQFTALKNSIREKLVSIVSKKTGMPISLVETVVKSVEAEA